MTPRLYAAYFAGTEAGVERGGQYVRMAHVLAYTAAQHCAGWDVQIEHIPHPARSSALQNASHLWNTSKLDAWVRAVEAAPDGTPLLLMDADMIIVGALDALWDTPFDLGYTVRSHGTLPFNGGVVALRVHDGTRAFMHRWGALNLAFLSDAEAHTPFRRRYAGINQASFGALLEAGDHGLQIAALPCELWNCENTCWGRFDHATRIVHIKSRLRRDVFGVSAPVHPKHKQLVTLWHALEQAMLRTRRQDRRAAVASCT